MERKRMFRSLLNARRIASISDRIREEFEALSFSTTTKETLLVLLERVRQEHGEKVAESLMQEISLEPETESEFFRTKNIITIARGFLLHREFQKERVSEMTREMLQIERTPISISVVPDSAFSVPWSESIHRDGYLFNRDDIKKVQEAKQKINEIKKDIEEIKRNYFLFKGGD